MIANVNRDMLLYASPQSVIFYSPKLPKAISLFWKYLVFDEVFQKNITAKQYHSPKGEKNCPSAPKDTWAKSGVLVYSSVYLLL